MQRVVPRAVQLVLNDDCRDACLRRFLNDGVVASERFLRLVESYGFAGFLVRASPATTIDTGSQS